MADAQFDIGMAGAEKIISDLSRIKSLMGGIQQISRPTFTSIDSYTSASSEAVGASPYTYKQGTSRLGDKRRNAAFAPIVGDYGNQMPGGVAFSDYSFSQRGVVTDRSSGVSSRIQYGGAGTYGVSNMYYDERKRYSQSLEEETRHLMSVRKEALGAGLGVMFFGMFVGQAVQSLIAPAADAVGVFDVLTAALVLLFLPAGLILLDWALAFLDWVEKLSPELKLLVSGLALFLAGILAILGFVGQLAIGAMALGSASSLIFGTAASGTAVATAGALSKGGLPGLAAKLSAAAAPAVALASAHPIPAATIGTLAFARMFGRQDPEIEANQRKMLGIGGGKDDLIGNSIMFALGAFNGLINSSRDLFEGAMSDPLRTNAYMQGMTGNPSSIVVYNSFFPSNAPNTHAGYETNTTLQR